MVLEGKRNVCMILMGNLDKELSPSTTVEFLHKHTQVSASVFIFSSLSSEIYTRGAIMSQTEQDFQKLYDFLTNPNHIITSSTGRYYVCILFINTDINVIYLINSLLWLFIIGSTGKSKFDL